MNTTFHGPQIDHLWESYHDHRMTFKSLKQNYILCSQLLKYLSNPSFIALAEPESVSTESSLPHAEVSQSVLDFWYYSCPTIQSNIKTSIAITD